MVIRGNCSSVIETHMKSATEKEKTKYSIVVQINAKMNDHIFTNVTTIFDLFPHQCSNLSLFIANKYDI